MMDELKDMFYKKGIDCSEKKLAQFSQFYQILIEWNKRMNLTAISEHDEVMIKHFYDSITPAFFFDFSNQKIIDIGVGAGFPSIPLKICFPELQMTLLDSLNKRITFLKNLVEQLGLMDIQYIHGRAEEIAKKKQYREAYDVVVTRAVAKLNILSELSLPFVKKDGYMIALKGSNAVEEVAEGKKAIKILGGRVKNVHTLQLPLNYGQRNIIIIDKTNNTPINYPRKPGTPTRNPIT